LRLILRTLAALAAVSLLAAGCSRVGSANSSPGSTSSSASATAAATGNFGSLSSVCHGGSASGATDQGVTASSILLGVLTDVGYSKDTSLENAATVFTDWCNAAGGIDGRKLVADIHDTQLMAVTSAMTAACGKDFVLAGGSAALDGLATQTRLQCLLPDFDAQPVMPQNAGSGLELSPYTYNYTYASYAGYYKWLFTKYPDSAQHVGILSAGTDVTTALAQAGVDTVKSDGGTVVYNGTFPISGMSNWTPYAEALKAHGVRGLLSYSTPEWIVPLETALDSIGYKLDWIDADTNSYGTNFTQLAGNALNEQTNYAELPGIYPVEEAASNPAVEQLVQLYQKYQPGTSISLQALQAWSMWLLFADAAETCGSGLTRACVYDAAVKQTAWTGGGITAPVNESAPQGAPSCFNIEQATPNGWVPAKFGANTGPYRCGENVIKLPAGFPASLQLSSVGKTLSDLK